MYRFFRFSKMASSVILDSRTMSSTPLCFTFWLCQWYLAWTTWKKEEVGRVGNASFRWSWRTVSHFVEIRFSTQSVPQSILIWTFTLRDPMGTTVSMAQHGIWWENTYSLNISLKVRTVVHSSAANLLLHQQVSRAAQNMDGEFSPDIAAGIRRKWDDVGASDIRNRH